MFDLSYRRKKVSGGVIKKWSVFVTLSAILLISGFFVFRANATVSNIQISAPNSSSAWRGIQDIQWTANGVEGDMVYIYYSVDNFASGEFIGDGLYNQVTFEWDTNTATALKGDGSNYSIKITDQKAPLAAGTSVGTFTIDNTAPETTATIVPVSPGPEGWYTEIPTITLTCDDFGGSGCNELFYKWDNEDDFTKVTYTAPVTISVPEGERTLTFYSTDKAVDNNEDNNEETPHDSELIKVDTIHPEITNQTINNPIFSPNGDEIKDTTSIDLEFSESVDYSIKIKDESDTVVKEWIETAINPNAKVWPEEEDITPLDGIYTIFVSIDDVAGNITENTLLTSLVVDTVNPEITDYNNPIENELYKISFPLEFTPSDDNVDITCSYKINNEELVTIEGCTNGVAFNGGISDINDGRQEIVVVVTDSAGNSKETTPISFVFDSDNTLIVDDDAPIESPADFTTIQEAIEKAEDGIDKIDVKAGTYTEDLWITEKDNLEIFSSESAVIKGMTLVDDSLTYYAEEPNIMILSDGVKIHGFTIESKNSEPDKHPVMITIGSSNVEIYDNDFKVAVGSRYGVAIVTYCDDTFCPSNPYNNNVDISGLNIHNNTFDSLTGEGRYQAIYINPDIGTELITIQDNIFDGKNRRAVSVERPNALIDLNTINTTLNVEDTSQGIALVNWYNNDIEDIDITNNTINGFKESIRLAHSDSTGLLSDIIVSGNTIQNSETGIYVYRSANGVVVSNKNTIINNTLGIQNDDVNTLDATYNWWGTAYMPTIETMINENPGEINFEPYYIDSGMTIQSDEAVETVYVDDDYDKDTIGYGYSAFSKIQEGVNKVQEGGTVNIAAGTYDEQVVINKNLILQGAGDTTIIKPSQATANNFQFFERKATGSGNDSTSVIAVVTPGGTVDIQNLKIDGSQVTSIPPIGGTLLFAGILYRDTNGIIDNITIENINIANGNGMYLVGHDYAVELEVGYCNISGYLKNGITANFPNMTADIHHNSVDGMGPTDSIAQNGIQIGFGATGAINDNTVVGNNYWTGTYGGSNDPISDINADGATGILLYHTLGNIDIKGNTLNGNQFGIWTVGAEGLNIENNTITGTSHIDSAYPTGIAIWDSDMWSDDFGYSEVGTTGVIKGNTFSEHDYGIIIRDYTSGGNVPIISAEGNKIADSTNYGAWSNISFDAEENWWGNPTGPYHSSNEAGTGDDVSDNVDFSPFCTDENCENLGSIGPIDYLTLEFDPTPVNLPYFSEITISALDEDDIKVVNDDSQLSLTADRGASFGSNLLTLENGIATTNISNIVSGIVNVTATQVGGILAVTNQVNFLGDTGAPSINEFYPADDSTDVGLSISPYLVFSESLKLSTVNSTNIKIADYTTTDAIPATVYLVEGGTKVIIDPAENLDPQGRYFFVITDGIQDEAGNPISEVWDSSNKDYHEFTTESIPEMVVNEIIAKNNFVKADDTFVNGWHYTYRITIYDMSETKMYVEFTDWVNPADEVEINGNTRLLFNTNNDGGITGGSIGLSDADIENGFGSVLSYAIGNLREEQTLDGVASAIDLTGIDNSTDPGRQIQFDVFTKIPLGTLPGFYETEYRILTEE